MLRKLLFGLLGFAALTAAPLAPAPADAASLPVQATTMQDLNQAALPVDQVRWVRCGYYQRCYVRPHRHWRRHHYYRRHWRHHRRYYHRHYRHHRRYYRPTYYYGAPVYDPAPVYAAPVYVGPGYGWGYGYRRGWGHRHWRHW
ncbi:MAG: hypothetical protein KGL46_12170 [Hyphomicrobiales bacterium]|nr:hypothetical protein [Hyphomicrobiales bacterium]